MNGRKRLDPREEIIIQIQIQIQITDEMRGEREREREEKDRLLYARTIPPPAHTHTNQPPCKME